MSEALPKGWAPARLGDVVSRPRQKAAPTDHPDLPFVGMDHIAPNGMTLLGSARFGDMKSNGGLFFDGDVLYGRMRPYLNKVHRAKFSGACSAEFIVFPQSPALNSDFLAYLLHHRRFVNFASGSSSGDRPRVDLDDISPYAFGLPPKPEQGRIVSKIEELFSRIDEGESALGRVRKLVGRYRHSLLKAAATGELTREWRRKNKGKPESGEALLARILKARREAWEKAELEKMKVRGVTPATDRWKQKYPEPSPPDTTDLRELPDGWVWASVDQLASEVSYGTSAKCSDDSSGVPVLRMGNIDTGELDLADLKYLPKKHNEFPTLLLSPGDLLFNRTNSAELVGKSAIFSGVDGQWSFASYLIRVRVLAIDANWIAFYINSVFGRAWIAKVKNQQVGQANVNGSKLKALPVPIPPLRELNAALDLLAQELARLKAAAASNEQELRRLAALRQSVLSAAFSGRLVPQDEAEEPAEALLQGMAANRDTRSTASGRDREKTAA